MRLLFNRFHGENPVSSGAGELEELCEFVELEFFINELCKIHVSAEGQTQKRTSEIILQKMGL
jgi:hypothetical protein